jgi:hypothetical protein
VVLLGGTSRAPLQGAVIAVSPRLQWAPILARASETVRSYDTSVTLRQLFYRLVSQLLLRTDCWDKVIRVALSAEQVTQYQLPPNPGKVTDSRAAGFVARHGELVQVEIDALPPETLRALFADEIAEYWDESAYAAVLEREDAERELLRTVAAVIEGQRW